MNKDPKIGSRPPVQSEPEGGEPRMDGKSSSVRYATDEQFQEAQRKTLTRFAEVFRRLAE